jgi:hypothetical protein
MRFYNPLAEANGNEVKLYFKETKLISLPSHLWDGDLIRAKALAKTNLRFLKAISSDECKKRQRWGFFTILALHDYHNI